MQRRLGEVGIWSIQIEKRKKENQIVWMVDDKKEINMDIVFHKGNEEDLRIENIIKNNINNIISIISIILTIF